MHEHVSLYTNWFWGVNLNDWTLRCGAYAVSDRRIHTFVKSCFLSHSPRPTRSAWLTYTAGYTFCIYMETWILILRLRSFVRLLFLLHLLFSSSHIDCLASALALAGWLARSIECHVLFDDDAQHIRILHTTQTILTWCDDCIRDNICASAYKINENQIKIKL